MIKLDHHYRYCIPSSNSLIPLLDWIKLPMLNQVILHDRIHIEYMYIVELF